MVLLVHSDASYHNMPKANIRARGHFFMSNNGDIPPQNELILKIAHITKAVMSSAGEAGLGTLFKYAKEAVCVRNIIKYMRRH